MLAALSRAHKRYLLLAKLRSATEPVRIEVEATVHQEITSIVGMQSLQDDSTVHAVSAVITR